MFPQRSQYFSCRLPNCTGCLVGFIVVCVPPKKKIPDAGRDRITAGFGYQSEIMKLQATGLDYFAMTCTEFVICKGGTLM
jgi:hypothetical protein